ncbi:hypothetical protein [Pseudanabaena minima]|uniref:hypothetical protein n=1 Tax=Pseudanabaena minima TaxID=890415 RepID=UPI003DA80276
MIDSDEWKTLQERASTLVTEELMFPYEYKQYFETENIPSEEDLKKCTELIDRCANDRQPPDIFTQYSADSGDWLP